MNCEICKDSGWVCENHPNVNWDGGNHKCCGGAGMPCECNKSDPPRSNFIAVFSSTDPNQKITEVH